MYRVDRRVHRHRRSQRIGGILLLLILCILILWALMHLKIAPKQDTHNSAPFSKGYSAATVAKVTIDKPFFKMELPSGWVEVPPGLGSTAPTFSFRSPNTQAQALDMYFNSIPVNMALNKAIVVSAQGDGLAYDSVSENCTTFTDAAKANTQTKNVPARWQETDFICDTGNFARAVVGTVSKEAINQITANGPKTGPHKMFITYIDNNINPSYSTLYDILASLRFK